MVAEIYGKLRNGNISIAERLEDELTGNFFGNMRYIPFNKGLGRILRNSFFPLELAEALGGIDGNHWPDGISFWRREDGIEPDILIEFDDIAILIEVKFLSGLSSDDDIDNSGNSEILERAESKNQLSREARLLERLGEKKTKFLILLAPQSSAHRIYSNVRQRDLVDGVIFGYMTWQRVLEELIGIETENPFEKAVIDDLIKLLQGKGFSGFKDFGAYMPEINASSLWVFGGVVSGDFSFGGERNVEWGQFYEFG